MWRVRVYLPTTLEMLDAAGLRHPEAVGPVELAAPGSLAYAVTPALREWYREGDLEELEYVALGHAALASLHLVASRSAAPRRVVLAGDVDDHDVAPEEATDVAAVRLVRGLRFDAVVSAHVDDPAAAADVAAAVGQLAAAAAGDDDAQFALGTVEDHELQWYAAQEIAFLLE
jgi:hypothetical protein